MKVQDEEEDRMKMVSRIAFLLLVLLLVSTTVFAQGRRNEPTIVDIALAVNAETGEFSTLIEAVVAADLVDTLNGRRHFTVFAPTDAAFAELGLNAGNIGSLPKDTLTNILLYHVTNGDRFSQSVLNAQRIRMLNGGFTFVSVTSDGAFINQSRLLAPDLIDIDASNGVIHVIDAVLLP
jgi:uncharacterized surface protein with fasciclin (FAS1) repeats